MEEDLASIGDMGDQIKQMESKQKAALKKQNAIPTNRVLPPKSSREDDAGGDLLARAKLLCAAASEMEAANADIISTFKANLGVADDAPAPKTGKGWHRAVKWNAFWTPVYSPGRSISVPIALQCA